MTPTAEWYEADADDSDRSTTNDVTANAHETARAANLPASDAPRGYSDAHLLRKRTAALDRVAAENERLRAEVERLQNELYADSEGRRTGPREAATLRRAEAAEAKLRGVEALIDSWPKYRADERSDYGRAIAQVRNALRDVLARSHAPQAPAEQEGCEGRVGWGSR